MTNLMDFDLFELKKKLDLPSFRASQIYQWIHKKHVVSFDAMTNLPQGSRVKMQEEYYISQPNVIKIQKSKDGSEKYLLELEDGHRIETVHMKEQKGRITICVSTQVGCPYACAFCATGKMGLKRNLSVSEILTQVYIADKANNIVFMGMGEPFLNYENVLKSISILNSKDGMGIGARRITISTAGLPEGIEKLAKDKMQIRLAVSLNAARDEVRSSIMPINIKYPLSALKSALKYYQKESGRRVTLEYVMLKDINDSQRDLKTLASFCRGLDVNVNLIPYNLCDRKFKPSESARVKAFLKYLSNNGVEAVRRISHGADILAACGQLGV